jgi:hypothetical protein
MATRRGAYPGTFNPATVAHLAIAEAARTQCRLDVVVFVLSAVPLGKSSHPELGSLDARATGLERVLAGRTDLAVETTDDQLLVDIARGFDVVILGADKWAQVNDERWYADADDRDRAVASLPHLAIAPRPPHPLPSPGPHVTHLDIDPSHHHVSSTGVRAGERRWLAAEPRVAEEP